MLFLMENAHCATAEDTEQNGAKHFTVARRAIVTCFRRVMIVFAGICKGKLKIVTCFARQKKFSCLSLWRTEARYDFEFSLQMPAKSIVTRLKHFTNARRAQENARFCYHTSLELWKQYDFRARCCWSRAGPVKKCHFQGRKPGSESIRRVSVWSSSKNQTRDLSGGLRGLQTGSESITHAFAWSSPNLNPETIC